MAQMAFRGVLLFMAVLGAMLLLGGVVVALSVAIYLALAQSIAPAAALVAACGLPLIVGASVLLLIPKRLQPCPRHAPQNGEDILAGLGNLAGLRVSNLVSAHPRKTAIASLLAGFAVGASPELRKALLNLLKAQA